MSSEAWRPHHRQVDTQKSKRFCMFSRCSELKCSRAGASGERHGNRGHLLGGREGGEPRQGKKERQPLGRQPAGTS